MKWTAYADVSVFLLIGILLFTNSTKNQKLALGEGVLIEHISSQTFSAVVDLPSYGFFKGNNLELLEMGNQMGNSTVASNGYCPFIGNVMKSGNYGLPGEQTGSILIFIEY